MANLSWSWIALELTALPLVAVLIAYAFWRKDQMIFGNIVGAGIVLSTAIALILREHVELDRIVQECLDDGKVCWPEPSAFTRFAIYASIAMLEVFALFALSLRVERRMRARDYAPEWRR